MKQHDAQPPPSWPPKVIYLTRSRISPSFSPLLVPLLCDGQYSPRPTPHPSHLAIKTITTPGHPACGQNGLFARKKIPGGELLIPYFGILHASFVPSSETANLPTGVKMDTEHDESDYDLCLLRISATETRNPYPGWHISIGVDAATCGNAGRFVNDYRGIGTAPNAEFRTGQGPGGDLRMEIWSLKNGIGKGEEILVSYGKGWWGARNSA